MGIAIVRLRWTPQQFWDATPHEFFSAVEVLELQAAAIEQ